MEISEETFNKMVEQNAKLLEQVEQLTEQVAYLTHKMYGRHSEKMDDPNQQSLFGDSGVFTEPEQTGEQSENSEESEINGKRRAKQKRSEIISANLPEEDKVYRRQSERCDQGHQLVKVGRHFVRQEVRLIPGRLYKENIYEETYKCADCERVDGISHMYQGKAPTALIAHSFASTSLVAEVGYHKFVLGTPLYRQQGYWKNQGLALSDKTMGNWVMAGAEIMRPLYQLLHKKAMGQRFLQGDETPYQVLHEPGKAPTSKSYVWVARTISRSEMPVVYYHYSPSRAGKVAQQLYSGFTGVLQCDGYYGYNAIADAVEHVGCWAHVRRKFFDDANTDKRHFRPSVGLSLINQMSKLEQQWRELPGNQRRQARQRELAPLIKQFWEWCDQVDVLPKTRLGKAVAYARGQRAALNRVLDYGEIDFTNNASERNMKSYVIGRKNWLLSTSPKGAEANAIWMTIIQSAKANGINEREYIEFLLEHNSQLPTFAKDSELEAYLPWNYTVPSKISVEV